MRTTDLVGPGLTYRQVEHWISQGWIPGVERKGSGVPVDLTPEQASYLLTMARLVQAGLQPSQARWAIDSSFPVSLDGEWRQTTLVPEVEIRFHLVTPPTED